MNENRRLQDGEISPAGVLSVRRKGVLTDMSCPHHDEGCNSTCAMFSEPYRGDQGDIFVHLCGQKYWVFRTLNDRRGGV